MLVHVPSTPLFVPQPLPTSVCLRPCLGGGSGTWGAALAGPGWPWRAATQQVSSEAGTGMMGRAWDGGPGDAPRRTCCRYKKRNLSWATLCIRLFVWRPLTCGSKWGVRHGENKGKSPPTSLPNRSLCADPQRGRWLDKERWGCCFWGRFLMKRGMQWGWEVSGEFSKRNGLIS